MDLLVSEGYELRVVSPGTAGMIADGGLSASSHFLLAPHASEESALSSEPP